MHDIKYFFLINVIKKFRGRGVSRDGRLPKT
jgi:hypothetical protein